MTPEQIEALLASGRGDPCPGVSPSTGDDRLRDLKARGWLRHTNGCSWEVRKDDGSKECNCGLIAALSTGAPDTEEQP